MKYFYGVIVLAAISLTIISVEAQDYYGKFPPTVAFSNITDGTNNLEAVSYRDVLTITAGENVTITFTEANNTIRFSAVGGGGGGSQTPWASNIDAASFSLDNAAFIQDSGPSPPSLGFVRMEHNIRICWDSNPTGTNICMRSSGGERFIFDTTLVSMDMGGAPIRQVGGLPSATAGAIRAANNQGVSFRNAADDNNHAIILDANEQIGYVGFPYSLTMTASGGTTPYSWSHTSGILPPGLTLNTSGVLSGTPTDTRALSGSALNISRSSLSMASIISKASSKRV